MGAAQAKPTPVLVTGAVGSGVDVLLKELAQGEQDRLVWNSFSMLHVATLMMAACEFTAFNIGKLSDAAMEMLYMMPLLQGKLAIVFVFDAATEESLKQSVAALRTLHGNYDRSAAGSSDPFGGALLLVLVRPTDLTKVSSTVADVAAIDSAKLVMKSLGVADELCNVLPIDVLRSPIALRSGLGWIREKLNSTKSAVKGKSLTAAEIRKKQEPQHEVGPPIIS